MVGFKNEVMEDWEKKAEQGDAPEITKKEPNDKPAAKTLNWTIFIAVIILGIIYLVFFHGND